MDHDNANVVSSQALAGLLLKRFGGRADAYLSQLPDGSYITVKEPLTPQLIERHLEGKKTVGPYMLMGDKVSWATTDFDASEQGHLEKLRHPVLLVKRLLAHYMIDSLLVDSGSKGYHLHLFFEEPIQAMLARQLLKRILWQLERETGLPMLHFEVFPKQETAQDSFGNTPKLPCGINRKSGRRCNILNDDFQPVENEVQTLADVAPTSTELVLAALDELPPLEPTDAQLKHKATGWVEEALRGVPEGQRHETMKRLAGYFTARGLPQPEVAAILRTWNERNAPPFPGHELDTQVTDMLKRWAPPTHSYADLEATFAKWLLIRDLDALKLVMATVVSHLLPGDPVWLLVIAPPSGTKTELILSLGDLPFVRYLPDINARTLASGEKGAHDFSLLADLTSAVLTVKDFTTILSKRWEERQEILSQLREVYDGRFEKRWGSGKELKWSGRLSLIAGVTPVIDTHHAVMQVLGERFLQLRLQSPNRQDMATKAIQHIGSEANMRAELRQAVASFFANLTVPQVLPISEELTRRLSALADFVTRARSGVLRDAYRRDLLLAPEPEAPPRLAKQVCRVLQGVTVVSGAIEPTEADYSLVYRLALDSIPTIRAQVMECLNDNGATPTAKIAQVISYPTSTTRYCLEELQCMGLVRVEKSGRGKADAWFLSKLACELLERAAPEVLQTDDMYPAYFS